jgi:hypothetical protein
MPITGGKAMNHPEVTDKLDGDYVFMKEGQFVVDVPNGWYHVCVRLGDLAPLPTQSFPVRTDIVLEDGKVNGTKEFPTPKSDPIVPWAGDVEVTDRSEG